MLHHIGLSVNQPEDIQNFYEEVLLFQIKHRTSIDGKIIEKIFQVPENVDICFMENQDTLFEIFIHSLQEKNVFSHVCLSYTGHTDIYHNAIQRGYRSVIKENPNHDTYFIWDHSGNMFEIKKAI